MRIFLVRHGHALADQEDPRRPLSLHGREISREVAAFLKASGALATVHAVWHSPLAFLAGTARRRENGLIQGGIRQ